MEVKRGITRTVLLTRHWAIKVPSVRARGFGVRGFLSSVTRGISANLSECAWSTSDTPGICPVRWSLAGLVSVYPRCIPVDPDHEIDWEAVGFPLPTDRKHQNVGWLNDRIVMIDYDTSWNDCPRCGVHPLPQ